jgi:hypothetical protein
MNNADKDQQHYDNMITRLRDAGEFAYQRYPNLLDPPCFRSSIQCARHLLEQFPGAVNWLVERPPCLRDVREAVLRASGSRRLLVPSKSGAAVYGIPPEALDGDGVLRIAPMPACARPYAGPVDLVVLGCHAFAPGCQRLFDLGIDANAVRFEKMEDGLDNGFRLDPSTIRVAIAADCQEVRPGQWPDHYLGYLWAHAVVTPTRIIDLRTGESEPLAPEGADTAGGCP